MESFNTLFEAQPLLDDWRLAYNHYRPHPSLNYMTPAEYARRRRTETQPELSQRLGRKTGPLTSTEAEMDAATTTSPRVYVSYRRDDAPDAAGRIYDRLAAQYGPDRVFFDVDTIPPGEDFVELINQRVAECDVLIAVIGRRWLTVKDGAGSRRIDNPHDYVHVEIAAALKRRILVVPALAGERVEVPKEDQLPPPLRALSHRNAINLTAERFGDGTHKLIADSTGLPSRALEKKRRGRNAKRRTGSDSSARRRSVRRRSEPRRGERHVSGLRRNCSRDRFPARGPA
jgi:hypothetical protein